MDQGFSGILGEMGFTGGGVVEAILTTVNPDGSFNAAPMGVYVTEAGRLELRPFKSSRTYGNLLGNPVACINVTDDPGVFLLTAFKDRPIEGFPRPHIDSEMRLSQSLAHIFVEATRIQDASDIRACFACSVHEVEVSNTVPRAFSRGRAEAIEAVIHATRIEVFSKELRRGDVERLIKRFAECKAVVERVTSPDSDERRVIGALEQMIAEWRTRT